MFPMKANDKYWKGAPKIDRLNHKIVEGSQLYAGLKSGEIDVTQNTMSAFRWRTMRCTRRWRM